MPILLAGALCAVVSGCGGKESSRQEGQLPDTLRVAAEISPMTLDISGDSLSGYSYELLELICRQHGLPFTIEAFNTLEEAEEASADRHYHVFFTNSPVTVQLKDSFIVTEPLYTDRQVLVQNSSVDKDSLIRTQQDLANRSVWIPRSSPVAERLRNLSEEMGAPIDIIELDSLSEELLVIKIALGEVPRGAVSKMTVEPMTARYPQLDISTDLSFSQFKSWLLNPADSMLLDSLNNWLAQCKNTEAYHKLAKKYNIR